MACTSNPGYFDECETSNELAWVEAAFRPAGRVLVGEKNGRRVEFSRSFCPGDVHTTRCEKYGAKFLCVCLPFGLRVLPWFSRRHESASWKTESEILATVANGLARAHVMMPAAAFRQSRSSRALALACAPLFYT